MKKTGLILVAMMLLSMYVTAFAAEAEFDVITASEGRTDYHWWEEVLWKSGVELDGKGIEIKYLGDRVLINYFRFAPIDGGQALTWTKFTSLMPKGAWVEVDGYAAYADIADQWGIRIDANMGDVGGQSLNANADMEQVPNVTLNPRLSGAYDIYVCVRATDDPNRFGLRLVDVNE